ncbi:hypothetical protein HPB51_024099 [Rhipicephalus microplus]|uniref:Secreted RxLR effector peptide protein n=1 Tax=Rhipicephalus microplus TaxID=6941 RepID=A0A9J6EDD7_RHIMP|nr:hypothetical protein HPB51_024099 [Rhipicephalus microplus]
MTSSASRRLLVVAGVTLWLACVSALPNETGSKPGVTASESVAAPVIGGAPPASRRAPRLDERKFKYDADPKKELTQFMNTKNLVKTLVKLVFGSDEESAATSRQVYLMCMVARLRLRRTQKD